MKTTLSFGIGILVVSFTACKDNTCGNQITGVQPNANMVNHEIIIHPQGFSQQAKVFFGLQQAVTRPGQGTDIIARVPVGLRSDVQISVQENSCIARTSFTVLDSLPGIYGLSLPDIILPNPPAVDPGGIGNFYHNLADPDHTIALADSSDSSVDQMSMASFETHKTNVFLGAKKPNPITGTRLLTAPYTIQLAIDRRANGGAIEVYDGQFIKNTFTANPNSQALALTSRTSGMQLILVIN
jgi:hypothetical protein